MTSVLAFEIRGHEPIQQGSKTAGKRNNGSAFVRDANAKRLKPWRKIVTEAAEKAAREQGFAQITGPVTCYLVFHMPRPLSAPRRLVWAFRKPDLDKLIRAVFDGLSDAKVWEDDARVVAVNALKILTDEGGDRSALQGVTIRVEPAS